MRKRTEPHSKKPSGGRPAPRRLFSFDALKKERSDSSADTSGPSRTGTILPEGSILETDEDPFADTGGWTEKPMVTSPVLEETIPKVETPPPLDLSKPGSIYSTSDASGAPPLSPSRRRWDTIRLHVLPSVSSTLDSIPAPSPPPDTLSIPTRPSTPKLPRFGYKRAFRQVVENVQTQQAGEHKRFAEAIRTACWNARFGETPHHPKPEREGTLGTVGSSLHLPFIASTTSLQIASSTSGSTIQGTNRSGGLRRPQSTQSLAQAARAVPTVTHISRVLSTFATSLSRPQHLPHENLVLSTLLLPFIDPSDGMQVDMEQVNAAETFEYAVRTWKAATTEAELERCLWCCKAASVPSKSRIRILGTLSAILFSRDKTFSADTPPVLQSLLQGLFSLRYCLSLSVYSVLEADSLAGYVSAIRSGSCGELTSVAIETEFGVPFSKSDNEVIIRDILVTESTVRCLTAGDNKCRRWMLLNVLEEYWPIPDSNIKLTRLQACAHWRKLQTFASSAVTLITQPSEDIYRDAEVIVNLVRTRIVPEIAAMPEEDSPEIRNKVVRLILELLCLQGGAAHEYALMQFCDWHRHHEVWKGSIEEALRDLIAHADWPTTLRLVPSVISQLPDDIKASVVSFTLPLMNNRLVSDPPEEPAPRLQRFLEDVAQSFPKIFYKPLFTCAAANKDLNVITQLCFLNALAKVLPDFWFRDAEMMSVALMSDAAGKTPPTSTDGQLPVSKARVGQYVLMIELLEQLRAVTQSRDLGMISIASRFAVGLETRLGVIIEAKEKSVQFSSPQRILFGSLFRVIRILTRSLKSAQWLGNVVSWVIQWSTPNADAKPQDQSDDETSSVSQKLHAIYVQAKDIRNGSGKRRNTAMSIFSIDKKASERSEVPETSGSEFDSRMKNIQTVLQARKATFFNLLVLISGLLTADHYARLGPIVWADLLSKLHMSATVPLCFLLMQFAEKRPEQFTALVEENLASADAFVRHQALQKIGILSTWRFQVSNQDVILDRAHRRPFRLQRPQILFVATDIGSSLFVYEDEDDEYKDINGHAIPLELRRRLSEIGWAEDRVVDRRLQRIRTPMTLLPSQQLERVDFDNDDTIPMPESQSPSPSPEPSPTKGNSPDTSLVRRESIIGRSQAVKRRPIFVATLVSLFPKIASLVTDRDLFVASEAQDVILDFMRDDPSLLARAAFHLISDEEGMLTAFSALRAFLHVRHILPPPMAHHILNHLTGFLKSAMRNTEALNMLRSYGYTVPIISKLVTQVSKVSVREIRRAKVDVLFIPSGSLWFPANAPNGPMFPRQLEDSANPFEDVPPSLVSITLIRTAQNMLFWRMLRKSPQDVKVVRKTMSGFVLPSLSRTGDNTALALVDLVPFHRDVEASTMSTTKVTLTALSLTLARSYLLLIEQIFQSMPRHLNDREELASLMDGINHILCVHGDDIGIVAHSMLALMTASTRFKRLFLSGGYTLFMPAVIKVYVEAEHHSNIRHAIEYAATRFYALHEEAFAFQTFDVMAQVLSFPHADGPWIAAGIYDLFAPLSSTFLGFSDAAGIHDLNKPQEREALMVSMAEEVPQFIAALKKSGNTQDRNAVDVTIPEQYEGKRLRVDNLVRLFLTVIAHDSGTQRAEQFLRFLRLLTPSLHGFSRPVQLVLRDGIDALGSILLAKANTKSKSSDGPPARSTEEEKYQDFTELKDTSSQRSAPGDLLTMRLEYLLLILAFTGVGGQTSHMTPIRIVELMKVLMKDATAVVAERISSFLSEYVKNVLLRESRSPTVKEVVILLDGLGPIASAYATKPGFNLSGLYDSLVQLASNPVYASEPTFIRLLVTQYCRIGLDACELVASEELLFSFPLRTKVVQLVNCLVPYAGSDILEQVESRVPTYDFLGGIIFPIVLTLKTSSELMQDSQWADGWRRDMFSRVWLRLLAYTLSIFDKRVLAAHRRSLSLTNAERRRSQGGRSTSQSIAPLMELCMALQILKVLIIRAEDELSTGAPELWAHMASLLKLTLADGDAMFAIRGRDYSEPPSPAMSPQLGSFGEQQRPLGTFPSTFSNHSRQSLSPPRMIDYLAWSMIQWLWLRRTPLMIPMRIFIQERIANLATELSLQGTLPLSAGGSASRPVSTVFSKPRRSMFVPSPASSAASTPRTSMLFNTSMSLPVLNDFAQSSGLSPSQGRQAGFARVSPISPSGRTSQDLNGQKIVHLGPVQSNTSQPRPVSIGSDPGIPATSAKALAKETLVRSPGLIRMTYRRIRTIQHFMGYTTLLPYGGSEYYAQDGLDMEMRVWTKTAAIEAIVDETKELMAEFKENDELGDDSMVYIDSQEFLFPASGSQES